VVGDSLLGQTYKYNNNAANLTDLAPGAISTGANSWAAGVSDTNTGLSFGNIHTSSGAGNPKANLLANGVNYLNITVGDDPLFAGDGQLAFSLYQGWAQGPGLLGMNLLGTVLASSVGQDIGLSLALTGNQPNGVNTGVNTPSWLVIKAQLVVNTDWL